MSQTKVLLCHVHGKSLSTFDLDAGQQNYVANGSLKNLDIMDFIVEASHTRSKQITELNRIGAMVVDIQPAAGTAVSLEDFFGA